MNNPSKPRFNLSRCQLLVAAAVVASQLVTPLNSVAGTTRVTKPGINEMDMYRFVEDCITANKEGNAQAAVIRGIFDRENDRLDITGAS